MAYNSFFEDIKGLLSEILGHPLKDSDSTWNQYCCPCCAAEKGVESDQKYNLEVSIEENWFHCWVCEDTMGTRGKLGKLISMYGGPTYYRRFMKIIDEMRKSQLYSLDKLAFSDRSSSALLDEYKTEVSLPKNYKLLNHDDTNAREAYKYLYDRGLNDDIINEFQIGYIGQCDNFQLQNRIVIPSYNCLDELNYWVARDYKHRNQKFRYANPRIPKTSFVFNEGRVNWYEDITLVEGVFDHIVTPNSLPLLGKSLNKNDEMFTVLTTRAMSNVNIMLDNDAYDNAIQIYKTLNSTPQLKDKVRFIPMEGGKDPSDVFKEQGSKGIIKLLRNTEQFDEFDLINWS